MLELRRVHILATVAAEGTMTAAAQYLHMTTSAVSQQIALLERELDLPLLERTGRLVRLNDAGQIEEIRLRERLDALQKERADREEELKAERVVHDAADEVLAAFRANPPENMDPRVLAEIRGIVERHSQDADEMPDPEAHTLRAEVFAQLYRDVLAAQRLALIGERDAGRIDDEAVRAMLERLDLQEAGVSARLESRF